MRALVAFSVLFDSHALHCFLIIFCYLLVKHVVFRQREILVRVIHCNYLFQLREKSGDSLSFLSYPFS